ncbi:MAG TPA: cysteine synthase A [Clostridia bacterium]|jgi:cysteine synthase A|nr:cysteine synthase A [Clostridia bacterium]
MLKNNIIDLIGNTPLLKLGETNIYAKLEYFNPLHSVKDRAALFMIKSAEKNGLLKPGGTIIEPTSGNTGIALTYIGIQLGYKVILTMPENMSEERVKLIKILGAEVVLTPKQEGMKGAIKEAEKLLNSIPNSFMPNQFENHANTMSHIKTTAREILDDLNVIKPNYIVLSFGTGGTLTGIGNVFKEKYPDIKIIAVEPAESPLLSEGKSAPHEIMGIGANFIPYILNEGLIDEIIKAPSEEATKTAIDAARTYGTLIGISSGANLWASYQIAKRDPSAIIVTLFPDTGERYLSVLKV